MSRYFLFYWLPSSADRTMKSDYPWMDHVGSEQLRKVKVGDIVWNVTIRPRVGLVLLCSLRVDEITDLETARNKLSYEPWGASVHIFARPEDIQPIREISLGSVLNRIRFVSEKASRLKVLNGIVKPQQLQSLRELTPASHILLTHIWEKENGLLTDDVNLRRAIGAGFGKPESNKKVERAAIEFARSQLSRTGWLAKSVESQKLGYDLSCTIGSQSLHVEVKGIAGSHPEFIITQGEVNQAKPDPCFRLCLVMNAISDPKLILLSVHEFLKQYELSPLAFRAKQKRDLW